MAGLLQQASQTLNNEQMGQLKKGFQLGQQIIYDKNMRRVCHSQSTSISVARRITIMPLFLLGPRTTKPASARERSFLTTAII